MNEIFNKQSATGTMPSASGAAGNVIDQLQNGITTLQSETDIWQSEGFMERDQFTRHLGFKAAHSIYRHIDPDANGRLVKFLNDPTKIRYHEPTKTYYFHKDLISEFPDRVTKMVQAVAQQAGPIPSPVQAVAADTSPVTEALVEKLTEIMKDNRKSHAEQIVAKDQTIAGLQQTIAALTDQLAIVKNEHAAASTALVSLKEKRDRESTLEDLVKEVHARVTRAEDRGWLSRLLGIKVFTL